MGRFIRKPLAPVDGGVPPGQWVDEAFAARWPALYEALTLTEWEDRKPRLTFTLLLVVDAGQLKMWVNDRDGEQSAWYTGESLEEVLGAVEMGLQGSCVPWRPNGKGGRRR